MDLINQKNIAAHLGRPLTSENKKITLWKPSPRFLHCCIESQGCRFSRSYGSCIMCDYGVGRNLTPEELTFSLEHELSNNLESITTLLVGTYGSVFDESEISLGCFDAILNYLKHIKINTVIFETHCSTVNEKILQKISNSLTNINTIIIEMGFESSDEFVLHKCLNKKLDLNVLSESLQLIHKYNMKACLNVFVGAPFIDTKAQINTSVDSIRWAFEHKADSVVIFPANIKPFTLMYRLYEKGYYSPISHWLIIEILSKLPQEYLGNISFSWFGDRENFYDNNNYPLVPPSSCEKCHDNIFKFYYSFMEETDSFQRKKLLEELITDQDVCTCYSELMYEAYNSNKCINEERINSIIRQLY